MFESSDSELEDDQVFDYLNRSRPKLRIFRRREQFLYTLDNVQFLRRFRLTKEAFQMLLSKIHNKIAPSTNRSHAISASNKLYAALRFYATGSFFLAVGDIGGVSEPSMSRIVVEVSEAIASMTSEYIKFPMTLHDRNETYEGFYKLGPGIPTVIGAIDCTHVKIQGQGGDHGEDFRNRKQFYSINVQSVSGPRLEFFDIVANWPGSTHDSFIFNQSTLKSRLESGEFGNSVLVGDGGYAVENYMMTPYRNPATEIEKHYNRIQSRTRNPVERKYGVWKRRFPCLAFGLRCKQGTILAVISACSVLHNFCIQHNVEQPPNEDEIENAIENTTLASTAAEETSPRTQSNGRIRRNVLASQLFNSRFTDYN